MEKKSKSIGEIEKKLLHGRSLYAVLDCNGERKVLGLFTSYDAGQAYRYRHAINFQIQMMNDDRRYAAECVNCLEKTFHDFAQREYKIVEVGHVDPTISPTYQLMNGNYYVFGEPEEYLTQSLNDFTRRTPYKAGANEQDWIKTALSRSTRNSQCF